MLFTISAPASAAWASVTAALAALYGFRAYTINRMMPARVPGVTAKVTLLNFAHVIVLQQDRGIAERLRSSMRLKLRQPPCSGIGTRVLREHAHPPFFYFPKFHWSAYGH